MKNIQIIDGAVNATYSGGPWRLVSISDIPRSLYPLTAHL